MTTNTTDEITEDRVKYILGVYIDDAKRVNSQAKGMAGSFQDRGFTKLVALPDLEPAGRYPVDLVPGTLLTYDKDTELRLQTAIKAAIESLADSGEYADKTTLETAKTAVNGTVFNCLVSSFTTGCFSITTQSKGLVAGIVTNISVVDGNIRVDKVAILS